MKRPTTPTPSNSPKSSKCNPSPIFRAKPPSTAQVIVISDDSCEDFSPVSSPAAVSSPIVIQREEQREDPFLQLSKDVDALIRRLKEEPEEEELVDIVALLGQQTLVEYTQCRMKFRMKQTKMYICTLKNLF